MRHFSWGSVLLRPLLCALLMGGCALALRGYLPLLGNVALAGLAYGGLLLAFGVVGPDELVFVRGLRRRAETSVAP
jgi:hypothetical protein